MNILYFKLYRYNHMLLLIPMEYQNVLHNIYNTHIKVFYGGYWGNRWWRSILCRRNKLVEGNIDESSLAAGVYCANALPPLGILLGCPRLPFVLLTTRALCTCIDISATHLQQYTSTPTYLRYTLRRSISLSCTYTRRMTLTGWTETKSSWKTRLGNSVSAMHLFFVHFSAFKSVPRIGARQLLTCVWKPRDTPSTVYSMYVYTRVYARLIGTRTTRASPFRTNDDGSSWSLARHGSTI